MLTLFATRLTVTMMSRITLNLKRSVGKLNDTNVRAELPSIFTKRSERINTNHDIKIVAPGFNNGNATINDFDEYDEDFGRSRGEIVPMPVISVVNPKTKSEVSTSKDKFDEEVASWNGGWDPLENPPRRYSRGMPLGDPIREVESGENVRFQAGIKLDPDDVS